MKKFDQHQLVNPIDHQIYTVGNDLVFLPDFYPLLTPQFIAKVYSAKEIAYCQQFDKSELRFASTWAAKEAVYKALKQQFDKVPFLGKIEILREKPSSKPEVILPNNFSNIRVSLTISHDGEYVWALALVKK